MDSVALMLADVIGKKKETWRLEGMEEDECLQVFNNTHAFANVKSPNDHKNLRHAAREIAKKLFGSSLAAKVMGGVLKNLDERLWTRLLNYDFRSAKSIKDDIFPILKLSFIFLPTYLQNCFAFSCTFPRGHSFGKDDLVRMWVTAGFIQPSINQGETLEVIGGNYFDILFNKSFFEETDSTLHYKMHKVGTKLYKMHDLLHELGQFVFVGECFNAMGDEDLFLNIPETIRHLSVSTTNLAVVRKVCKCKKLQMLCIIYNPYIQNDCDDQQFANTLAEIFKENRGIRLLYISSSCLKMIPEEIKYLIHLRYFWHQSANIKLLPRSLSNLYHLQFMTLGYLFHPLSNDFFPRDMNNLSNLRYLCLSDYQFPGIGKLKLLQEMNGFYVKNENDYRIGELEHMNYLRLLRISLLENVRDADEACNAKLCDKINLMDLSLECGSPAAGQNIVDPDLHERVLDNLQPHNSLKSLGISRYMGGKFAIWMSKAHSISNLKHIEFNKCLDLQTIPSFGHLPSLEFLFLNDMPKAKQFDSNAMRCAFSSLIVLCFERLEALEDWFDARITAEDDCLFPFLTALSLEDCPNLLELPYLPHNIKNLMIKNIRWKTLKICSISKCIPLKNFQHFISLG